VALQRRLAMYKSQLEQGTKSVLTFFRKLHRRVDLFLVS
jgi:hypothetical protein